MTLKVNDQELKAVLSLSDVDRYRYFVKRVADSEKVWSLRDQHGWVLCGDDTGQELVPVWPHARFAEVCADSARISDKPAAIDLSEWLEDWTPGIIRDRRQVAVFPGVGMKHAVVVSAARLKSDLEEELSQY